MGSREEGTVEVNDPELEIIRLNDEIEMLKKDLHASKQAEHQTFMDAATINKMNDRLRASLRRIAYATCPADNDGDAFVERLQGIAMTALNEVKETEK
jgi:hypothetical protein